MDIGSLITKRIDDGGFKQSALAAQFVDLAKARKIERNRNTVESHLSRLKSSDRTAVVFFFSDPRDAEDLLNLLGFPAAERGALIETANEVLAPEERPVRLVVDLTTGPQDRGFVDLCEAVSREFLDRVPPRVVLVMTRAQHENLLPKYAPESRVGVEVVQDPAAGVVRARALAGETAVIASTWRFHPLPRWIAVRWPERNSTALTVAPPDAIDALSGGRPLSGEEVLPLERDLAALAPDATPTAPPKEYAPDAPSLRRLTLALIRGEPIKLHLDGSMMSSAGSTVSPRVRQSWALHLGVHTTATPGEWTEHLVQVAKEAGAAEVVRGDKGTLRVEMTNVERGEKAPRVVVEGISVHVINPTPASADRLRGLIGMTVHEVSPKQSGLGRLRAALANTSRQALLDDPYLERMVASLTDQGGNPAELAFVAACLLTNDATNTQDAPRLRSWHSALRALLAFDPPAAGLRLPRGTKATSGRAFDRIVLRAPKGPATSQETHTEACGVPAAEPLRLVRGERPLLGTPATDSYGRSTTVIPCPLAFDDELVVFRAFEKSPFRAGRRPVGDPWRASAVKLKDDFWSEADRHLAVTWLALRRAAGRADALTLHDGTGILEMGSGLVAEVSAYEVPPCPRAAPCEAELMLPLFDLSFDRETNASGLKGDAVLGPIVTRSAETDGYVTSMQAKVPHELFLASESLRVIVRFRATPWDAAPFGSNDPLPSAARAIARRSDEANDDD